MKRLGWVVGEVGAYIDVGLSSCSVVGSRHFVIEVGRAKLS